MCHLCSRAQVAFFDELGKLQTTALEDHHRVMLESPASKVLEQSAHCLVMLGSPASKVLYQVLVIA